MLKHVVIEKAGFEVMGALKVQRRAFRSLTDVIVESCLSSAVHLLSGTENTMQLQGRLVLMILLFWTTYALHCYIQHRSHAKVKLIKGWKRWFPLRKIGVVCLND